MRRQLEDETERCAELERELFDAQREVRHVASSAYNELQARDAHDLEMSQALANAHEQNAILHRLLASVQPELAQEKERASNVRNDLRYILMRERQRELEAEVEAYNERGSAIWRELVEEREHTANMQRVLVDMQRELHSDKDASLRHSLTASSDRYRRTLCRDE